MKIRGRRRDQSKFGAIDYVLMAAGNCFGAYSAGMSMNQPDIAWFFVYAILGGSLFSLLVRRLFGETRLVRVDAFLYAGATISAVLLTPVLNSWLPGDGIPQDVFTAGWLCWMLAFGSALTWRDRTLLFQAVPTIALFGLVGCYDTYSSAPFMFFGFLLCLATLLGRAHSREMLRQAVESGYFNRADAPNTPTTYPEQSAELYEDIKRGPWRWLAGPEWALVSGLAIVFVSLLGAPVIQLAVLPLSGVIKVAVPHRNYHRELAAPTPSSYTSGYEVGRGPLFDQHARPVSLFIAKLDRTRYLRTATYDRYTGHGWRSTYVASLPASEAGPSQFAMESMAKPHKYHISIQPLTNSALLPLPAETISASGSASQIIIRQDGGGEAVQFRPSEIDIDAVESKEQPSATLKNLPRILLPTLDTTGIQPSVQAFADEAVKGRRSDYEKADAIAAAIDQRCTYSLSATAVPSGSDSADFFLNSSKTGYCDLFATAMVECARAEGLPARYALGYLPDAMNSKGGSTVIVDKDYHAWAEIFFKNVGWVVFDATAGASLASGSGDSGLTNSVWSPVFFTALNSLIFLIAFGLIGFWLYRNLSRKAARKTVRAEIEKEFIFFARALNRLSHRRRRLSETPDEYLAAVRPMLNGSAEAAESITLKFVNALYSPTETPEILLNELKTDVKQFVRMSKKRSKNDGSRKGT